MTTLQKEIDRILSQHPAFYCGDGREKVRQASQQELVRYGCTEKNLLQWEWGNGKLSTDFFIKFAKDFAESGVQLFFNRVPNASENPKETDIILVDQVDGLDFTQCPCRIAVKDRLVTVGDNRVNAYGSARVVSKGATDAVMEHQSHFHGTQEHCMAELFDQATASGIGTIINSTEK